MKSLKSFVITNHRILYINKKYIIIRKTWKGMNQTKMEGGTERHLLRQTIGIIGSTD